MRVVSPLRVLWLGNGFGGDLGVVELVALVREGGMVAAVACGGGEFGWS